MHRPSRAPRLAHPVCCRLHAFCGRARVSGSGARESVSRAAKSGKGESTRQADDAGEARHGNIRWRIRKEPSRKTFPRSCACCYRSPQSPSLRPFGISISCPGVRCSDDGTSERRVLVEREMHQHGIVAVGVSDEHPLKMCLSLSLSTSIERATSRSRRRTPRTRE
jgi:hypothetical protein